eukprot:98764_1
MGSYLSHISDTEESINIGNSFQKLDKGLYSYYCSTQPEYARNLYYNSNNVGKIEIICYENEINENRLQHNLDEIAKAVARDKTFPHSHDASKILQILKNCFSNINFYSDYNLEIKYDFDDDFDDIDYDYQTCVSLDKCPHTNNIILGLKYYSQITDPKQMKRFIEYFNNENNDKNINLVQSYHHLLSTHLNNVTKAENIKNFEYIHNTIMKTIQKCNLNNCQPFARNYRDRKKHNSIGLSGIDDTDYSSIFYIDLLDSMHTLFVHSFDTGFRIKMNHEQISNQTGIDVFDSELKFVQDFIDKKQKELTQVNDINKKGNNKFTSQTFEEIEEDKPLLDRLIDHLISNNVEIEEVIKWHQFLSENAYDTDCVTYEVNIEGCSTNIHNDFNSELVEFIKNFIKRSNNPADIIEYGFGERFYYWDHFKNEPFYVVSKYANIKEELCLNGWGQKIFDDIHKKAVTFLHKSPQLKKMRSDYDYDTDYNKHSDEYYYDIDLYSPLQVRHVTAMLLYTNYTDLSYDISKSFRKISKMETDSSLKYRNSLYANINKALREIVECYGQRIYLSSDPLFYHGVSYLYFNKFVTSFYGPTSTTKQMEVALIFSDEGGLLLQLQQSAYDDRNLKYFDCSLVSTFTNEDERLFCGGAYQIRFKSITLIKTATNLENFIRILTIFDNITNGRSTAASDDDLNVVGTFFNVNKMLSLPFIYVKKCFELFCIEKQIIKINMEHLHWNYPTIAKHIITKMPNLLNFSVVMKLFRNVHIIYCL